VAAPAAGARPPAGSRSAAQPGSAARQRSPAAQPRAAQRRAPARRPTSRPLRRCGVARLGYFCWRCSSACGTGRGAAMEVRGGRRRGRGAGPAARARRVQARGASRRAVRPGARRAARARARKRARRRTCLSASVCLPLPEDRPSCARATRWGAPREGDAPGRAVPRAQIATAGRPPPGPRPPWGPPTLEKSVPPAYNTTPPSHLGASAGAAIAAAADAMRRAPVAVDLGIWSARRRAVAPSVCNGGTVRRGARLYSGARGPRRKLCGATRIRGLKGGGRRRGGPHPGAPPQQDEEQHAKDAALPGTLLPRPRACDSRWRPGRGERAARWGRAAAAGWGRVRPLQAARQLQRHDAAASGALVATTRAAGGRARVAVVPAGGGAHPSGLPARRRPPARGARARRRRLPRPAPPAAGRISSKVFQNPAQTPLTRLLPVPHQPAFSARRASGRGQKRPQPAHNR
jgi:hypothetical protein